MEKFKLRNFHVGIWLFLILGFLEVSFRLFTNSSLFDIGMIYVLLFNAMIALFFSAILRIINANITRKIYLILVFLSCFIYEVQFCVFKMFGFYFDWSLFGASEQVAKFAGDGLRLIISNIFGVIILLLPFLILLFNLKCVNYRKDKKGICFIKLGLSILLFGSFLLSLNINKDEINSSYKLLYKINNNELNIKRFGVLHAFIIDSKRSVFGFKEVIDIVEKENNEGEVTRPSEIVYEYNNLDIDFDKLIEEESNENIIDMHRYFKNESGTKQNKYTKFFEGKNLILFMAESFNEIAVREDLTPTLYKLVNSGFVFKDFYTPTISSTIGGEFQELTGLVAASGFLSPWKSGENDFTMGIGKVFKDMGYNTHAYHNHNYTFQSRNKYLEAIGFDNFLGCRNGLETRINCKIWPESDIEMINATVDDYINSEDPFFTYYVTVSGHGDYSFSQSAMAKKNKDLVSHLDYSVKPLSYLAAQIELDRALETLINRLDSAGKLDDTVIALVGDHYPYYLSLDEVNEISSYEKDSVVEINHSNFILWNNKMESVEVTKVGSQIDVLPTIYNLFGVKYDSRLIIGKDILADNEGLAIFGNGSWVSDKGTYFSGSGKFIARDGIDVNDDYVKLKTNEVSGKIVMSKYIMTNDYYRKVFGD